jgi:integrase
MPMDAKGPKRPLTNRSGKVPVKWVESRQRWQLSIHKDGKRTRTFHKTEEAAEKAWSTHCARLKRFGTDALHFSAEELREFAEARRIIPGVDLREAAQFFRHHHPDGAAETTIAEAVAAYLEHQSKKALSKRHMDALRLHCETFAQDLPTRSIRAIGGNDLLLWLQGLRCEPRTARNYAGSLASFFNWCERRGLVSRSPAKSIHETDMPRAIPKAKTVLTVDQCAKLMDFMAAHYPKYVPWHALQLFAGIRRAEVGRMTWDCLDLEAKTVTLFGFEDGKRIVKTGDDWVLHDLPASLWEWLREFPGKGKIRVPGNDTIERIRGEELPSIGIPTWPKNAMRHTFCTMLMSLHGDAAKVANWSRHTNAAQLYKSYVAKLVSREEAGRFCGILPQR